MDLCAMEKMVKQGLLANWRQFSLLVLINGFIGAMVGIERTILAPLAASSFGIKAATATFSFIIAFGLVKAVSNYFAGRLANFFGRKNLLITGWLFGLPVPFILLYAPSWNWVVFANVLLGINQGLAWSTNVLMKIELASEKRRGLAMGLNEFAGYLAVALAAFVTGWLAGNYGIRPYPFYLGIAVAITGLLLTVLFVKDTHGHALTEHKTNTTPRLSNVFVQTTLTHRNLGAITQAGLVNNLNDGMVWGLLPVVLVQKGFHFEQVGWIASMYPAVWGMAQLFTGGLADKWQKKTLIFYGMLLQGIAILFFLIAHSFWQYMTIAIILGLGTAMVYPTFLAGIAAFTHPADRPQSLGTFRFWRDLGYALGALATGLLSDFAGYDTAIGTIGVITILSAMVIQLRMEKS